MMFRSGLIDIFSRGTGIIYNLILAAITVFSFLLFSCDTLTVEKFYKNGVVATSSPIASDVGLKVLKNGGNAFDAAVAVGFAMAVCLPEAGNIGGGGFALVYNNKSGEVTALDFRETAPAKATADMYLDEHGIVVRNSSLIGAKAAGVPGTVAGLYELWKKYGSLEWSELIQPAIDLADTGFIINDYLAESFSTYEKSLRTFPETEDLFLKNGAVLKKGERLIQSDLAGTLNRISRDSTDGFYAGEMADFIVQTMQKHGGLIDHDDLRGYQPVWRRPVNFSFDDTLSIYSMPPPSSGGVIFGQILKLLEPFEFATYSCDSPEYIHLFAEACRLAFADRSVYLGDPDFVENPTSQLLDSAYLDSRRKLINIERAGNSENVKAGAFGHSIESESTTHFCIVDRDGNAVSLTYTLNTSFGSKLVVDGAGFLLNNEMDDFSIKPGVANAWGLVGGKANEIAPGKRMLSSMSPTIVLKKGKPVLVLGSPGGSKIITTVAEAIISVSRYGLNIQQIVKQPRFHHQWMPDTLYLEMGGFDINVIQSLITLGHNIKERQPYSDLQIVYINESGLFSGASDPRRGGKTVGF
jgi:gamma-glutamyltranspeptidase/glutathione hydrolase